MAPKANVLPIRRQAIKCYNSSMNGQAIVGVTTSANIIDFAKKDRKRFGGVRQIVLERDNYKCVKCHMSQTKHIAKWGKSLTINHIDGNGRNSSKPNNALSNLETLCLRCHGYADCKNKKWHEKST